jgi:hypothetical protein
MGNGKQPTFMCPGQAETFFLKSLLGSFIEIFKITNDIGEIWDTWSQGESGKKTAYTTLAS